jgi:hypothetical protein
VSAIQKFNNCVQAAWESTSINFNTKSNLQCSTIVKELMEKKEKVMAIIKISSYKKWLNFLTKKLKNTFHKERSNVIQEYLKNLNCTIATDYSLWKATKKIKQPQPSLASMQIT